MRVAVYIRVSTHMQVEDGYSLAAQKNRRVSQLRTWSVLIYKKC